MRVHLTEPGLLRLDAVGALLMATFAAVYNGLTFRLEEAPYGLSHAAVAAIFLVYPIGSFSSAWAGRLADRIGRRPVLPLAIALAGVGLALTGASSLPLIVLGVATLTAGFFAGHSVASSWVGRRGSRSAGSAAQASALYLFAYYAGSSLGGVAAGAAWSGGHWTAVMGVGAVLLTGALLMSLRLRRTPPLAEPAAAPRSRSPPDARPGVGAGLGVAGPITAVQYMQRLASVGISERHSGQARTFASPSASGFFSSRSSGSTTRK